MSRLWPPRADLPTRPQTVAAVCSFPSVRAAVETTVTLLQAGLPLSKVEFLDELSMKAANEYFDLSYPVLPSLFMEFTGSAHSVVEQADTAGG